MRVELGVRLLELGLEIEQLLARARVRARARARARARVRAG